MSTSPALGKTSPVIILKVVLLPAPLIPSRPKHWPGLMPSEIFDRGQHTWKRPCPNDESEIADALDEHGAQISANFVKVKWRILAPIAKVSLDLGHVVQMGHFQHALAQTIMRKKNCENQLQHLVYGRQLWRFFAQAIQHCGSGGGAHTDENVQRTADHKRRAC
ncbi:hypothetical protein BpHYR1_052718 [Brachionus plicatilis]|uniref:Uncharacterized protein n=1 Tax=Brachionus plicatilis TaxID=10195 RepID=A0A3M7SKN4_BRAPC|nr:hypothetical protein BpHYR1_052718 [Brachionus plicatilis]